jgi:hypothetical protein
VRRDIGSTGSTGDAWSAEWCGQSGARQEQDEPGTQARDPA